jgi:hypothetical protein
MISHFYVTRHEACILLQVDCSGAGLLNQEYIFNTLSMCTFCLFRCHEDLSDQWCVNLPSVYLISACKIDLKTRISIYKIHCLKILIPSSLLWSSNLSQQ